MGGPIRASANTLSWLVSSEHLEVECLEGEGPQKNYETPTSCRERETQAKIWKARGATALQGLAFLHRRLLAPEQCRLFVSLLPRPLGAAAR